MKTIWHEDVKFTVILLIGNLSHEAVEAIFVEQSIAISIFLEEIVQFSFVSAFDQKNVHHAINLNNFPSISLYI